MDYELKDRILTLSLYIQNLITLLVVIATLTILVFSRKVSSIYITYVSVLIASIISGCIFIRLNWSYDGETISEFYFDTKEKYSLMLVLLSLQSLFIPFIAIFIINIVIFKHYSDHIFICFLSSILISAFCCFKFFIKLDRAFCSAYSLINTNIKCVILFYQIIFVLIYSIILSYILIK
jgi:hypothetical protein